MIESLLISSSSNIIWPRRSNIGWSRIAHGVDLRVYVDLVVSCLNLVNQDGLDVVAVDIEYARLILLHKKRVQDSLTFQHSITDNDE